MQVYSSFCLQLCANDSYAAEGPSLTSYKDKSDEFSLSVPASKQPTHRSPQCFLQQTIVQMTWRCTWPTCLKPFCCSAFLSHHVVVLFAAAVQCCTSHIDISLKRNNCCLRKRTVCSNQKGNVAHRLGGWGGSSSRWQRLHGRQRCTQSSGLVCLLKHIASALHSHQIMLQTLDLAW